ncbi:hypothetical protein BSBH6_01464 [Bacillus subtilis]|nr:hypothetical protein BSBH6_01464 [Bacillus subtilis]RPK16988.1 hypothetical protein BH5_01456 [Bacillus subtilis]
MVQYASESINLPGEITFKDVREIFFIKSGKSHSFTFFYFAPFLLQFIPLTDGPVSFLAATRLTCL